MTSRAKLKLTHITSEDHGLTEPYKTLNFSAQYDALIPEDKRFQKATPTGSAKLQVDNPAALAYFKVGKYYYVDFSEAE